MERLKSFTLTIFLASLIALTGCENLVPHYTESLLDPNPLGRRVIANRSPPFLIQNGFIRTMRKRLL
jgi:hypothetical protein